MHKKYFKELILVPALLLLFLACQRDDICPEATQTTPLLVINFYDAEERDSPRTPTNLTLRSRVEGVDTSLFVRNNTSSIAIPLRTNQNTTTYTFTIFDAAEDEQDPEFDPDTDTLTFTYGREQVYVNRACAYKTIYNALKLTIDDGEDGNWIDSYIIEEPEIEDETQAHISIFF